MITIRETVLRRTVADLPVAEDFETRERQIAEQPGRDRSEGPRFCRPRLFGGGLRRGRDGMGSASERGRLGCAEGGSGTRNSEHLELLGLPGPTAWAGMTQLATVKLGDTATIDAG